MPGGHFEVDGDDACGDGDRVLVGVGLVRAALRAAAWVANLGVGLHRNPAGGFLLRPS
jgi:hypothetical protein